MGAITATYDKDKNVVFEPPEVAAEVLNTWSTVFSGQSTPVFQDSKLPDLPDLADDDPLLENLCKQDPRKHENTVCRPYTSEGLKKMLNSMKINKSIG